LNAGKLYLQTMFSAVVWYSAFSRKTQTSVKLVFDVDHECKFVIYLMIVCGSISYSYTAPRV